MARQEMSSEEKLTIHSMKSNGMPVKEIAKRFKRSSKLIYRALKEVGAANGVVSAAATIEPTRTTAPAAQSSQQVPMDQQVPPQQVPQPQRAESSAQLLPMLPYEIHQQPLQMNAQLRPPPPKQRRTAQRNPSAQSPPPVQPSYAPLPLYLPSESFDKRHEFVTDALPAASSAMTELSVPVPAPAVRTSKSATQTGRQAVNLQLVQQSSLPPFTPPQLQEDTSPLSVPRQMEQSTLRSVPPQPKPSQSVPSPSPEHHQTLSQKILAPSDRSESACVASLVQPASTALAAPVDVVSGGVGVKSGGILAVKRPITRPPRVFPFTRPAPTLKVSADITGEDKTYESVFSGGNTAEIKATSYQRVGARAETMVEPNIDLVASMIDLAPDEDTSPQTSQEDRKCSECCRSSRIMIKLIANQLCLMRETGLASSQFDNLSQVSSTSTIVQRKATSGASILTFSQTKGYAALPVVEQKPNEMNRQESRSQGRALSKVQLVVTSRGASASHSQTSLPKQRDCVKAVSSGIFSSRGLSKDCPNDQRGLQQSVSSVRDQVDLQQEHNEDDSSNLHRLVSAFRDELGSSNNNTTAECSERKRKRDEDADNMILGKLLHEKMAAEVALMNLQVQREKAQLARERMKTEVEAALSRKKLEDAKIPKFTIDSIFAQMMAD